MLLPDVHKGDWLACKTVSGAWLPKIAAKDGIHRAAVARDPWPVVSVTDQKTKRTFNWPAEDVLVICSVGTERQDA